MQDCYTDNAKFSDPVFTNLNARQVRAMWEMFCTKSHDLQIEYKNISANDTSGKGEWIATYTFSKTGRQVVNHIYSEFSFLNGKIVKHTDRFNFYKWCSQALGTTGKLLGWSGFIQSKIRAGGTKSLYHFMNSNLEQS